MIVSIEGYCYLMNVTRRVK